MASIAAMIRGRSSCGAMTASTEPTSTARWMSCTRSNSEATLPSISARTAVRTESSSVARAARSAPLASPTRVWSSATRWSPAVRASTSRAKTTAAAGAPPMTEANDPSTASTVIRGLSALENTTNAPPW